VRRKDKHRRRPSIRAATSRFFLQDEEPIFEVSAEAADEKREGSNLQAQLGMSDKKLSSNLKRLKRLRREKIIHRASIVLVTIGIVVAILVFPLAQGFLWPGPSTFNSTCKAIIFLVGFWAIWELIVELILRLVTRVVVWVGQVDEKNI
jgi:hypothetical protein